MIVKKTHTYTKTYEIIKCFKWDFTIGEWIKLRSDRGLEIQELGNCFMCNRVLEDSEIPYIAIVKGTRNKFICSKCAEKIKESDKDDK